MRLHINQEQVLNLLKHIDATQDEPVKMRSSPSWVTSVTAATISTNGSMVSRVTCRRFWTGSTLTTNLRIGKPGLLCR